MASYLVETYLPRGYVLSEAVARMRAAAEASSLQGVPVRYLRSIFVPEDETCFHLLEGPSTDAVAQVGERAGLVGNRVVEAIS
jgi:hypothetical protein